jgi:undecaprenyl-diphosphatase
MDWLTATLYGIIQGLTEFLPVSSSGHLALLPKIMEFKDPGVLFDLSMHVGTAVAIMVYFHKDLIHMTKSLFTIVQEKKITSASCYPINMIISTITTLVVVLTIKDPAMEHGRASTMIGINLIAFGILMFISDFRGTEKETDYMFNMIRPARAFMIGFFQALAIFPGVSRSGSTLTISRFMGLSRIESTRYSFLLSLPIIIGGFILKLPEMIKGDQAFELAPCLLGGLVSFGVGFITIHYFLKLISKIGLGAFALYRIILGGLIFWLL